VKVRRPTRGDAAAVTALIGAMDLQFLAEPELTEQDVLDEWRDLELGKDAWLVELDGRLAGYVALHPQAHRYIDGYVHPDEWGHGVGTRLLELAELEARRRGLTTIQNAVLDKDEPAKALLRSRGYREVRHFYRMTIELDGPPPEPEWPDGLEVEPFVYPDESEAFHAALDEAFEEEWGHEPERVVDWQARRERPGFDPTLWFTVKERGEIAGAIVCDEDRFGMGWIQSIGVRKPWRRHGLGFALLLHAFGELYRRDRRVIGLGVDTQNPTGATRLYERAGMKVAWTGAFFEKELAG
jgi:mycothiol synthase